MLSRTAGPASLPRIISARYKRQHIRQLAQGCTGKALVKTPLVVRHARGFSRHNIGRKDVHRYRFR
jgi:hypothetical protein